MRIELLEARLGEELQVEFSIGAGLGNHIHEDHEVLLPFTGAQVNSKLSRIDRRVEHARIFDRLHGCGHRKLHVAPRQLKSLNVLVMIFQLEVFDFGGKLRREIGGVEEGDLFDAVAPLLQ